MAWAKLFTASNVVPKKTFSRFTKIGEKLLNMGDPIVGDKLVKLQRPNLLARVHGEEIQTLKEKDGFHPRISLEELLGIRHSRVEKYQQYNEDPFAWGGCASIKDLMTFMKENHAHAKERWIYKFYTQSTSLGMLKCEAGIEIQNHDNENEEMFVQHVPFSQFIAATCPAYREKFFEGKLVPNVMHKFNAELPKSMRIKDIFTEKDVLSWLLEHNSEGPFAEICNHLYAELPEDCLKRRLGNDSTLVQAVQAALGAHAGLQL